MHASPQPDLGLVVGAGVWAPPERVRNSTSRPITPSETNTMHKETDPPSSISSHIENAVGETNSSSTYGRNGDCVEAVKKLRAHKAGAGAAAGRVAFLEVLLFVVFVWSGAS
ncbi:hypothetical protein E4U57_002768 [Claviceps arundinis]|uniref:Uncharacterized protein n=1 Tax=Claviceps arundinis TaxID=1623583 RepID=A0ABQ7P8C9_9HYPO|nr:hypothetical protein E4U57_002768 [Claviceps arundinis]